MMIEITEQEWLVAINGMRVAATTYMKDAWLLAGPRGTRPDPAIHQTLMRQGEACEAIAVKLENGWLQRSAADETLTVKPEDAP